MTTDPTTDEADAPRVYAVGDPDPTADEGPFCGEWAWSRDRYCTWHYRHEHPQHVSGDGDVIVAVWPVAQAAEGERCTCATDGAATAREDALGDALAAVRAAVERHPDPCAAHPKDAAVECGWKRAVADVHAALAEIREWTEVTP